MYKTKSKAYTIRVDEDEDKTIKRIAEKLNRKSIPDCIRASLSIIDGLCDYIDDNGNFTVVDPNEKNVHVKFKLLK